MSKNRLFGYALLFIFASFSSFPFRPAAAGTETHGGQGISKEGEVWLKDLVTSATCKWTSGKRFSTQIPGYPTLLIKMFNPNYYFGMLLFEQEDKINVCLTDQPLLPIPEPDQDILLPFEHQGQQVAIRAHFDDEETDTVFINRPLFESMSIEMQRHLWLHEQLHGMLKKSASIRLIRLQSFVKYIFSQREAVILPADEFNFQLAAAQIDFSGLGAALLNAVLRQELGLAEQLILSGGDPNKSGAFLQALSLGNQAILEMLFRHVNLSEPVKSNPALLKELYQGCLTGNHLARFGFDLKGAELATLPHNLATAAIFKFACSYGGETDSQRESWNQAMKEQISSILPKLKANLIQGTPLAVDGPTHSIPETLLLLGRPELAEVVAAEIPISAESRRLMRLEINVLLNDSLPQGRMKAYQDLLASPALATH